MIPTFARANRGCAATIALDAAREHERAARIPEAMEEFAAAIAHAESARDPVTIADAARRLAVLHQQRGDPAEARRLCAQSHEVASGAGLRKLAAEALNTMGVIRIDRKSTRLNSSHSQRSYA